MDRPLRILLVEDEAPNRALVAAIFASRLAAALGPTELREAAKLADARAQMSGWAPDLILLDIRLADGDGLDLVRELPPAGAPGRPTVVVMSASVLPQQRELAERAGVDAFLGKPYRPTELMELLTALTRPRPNADDPDPEGSS